VGRRFGAETSLRKPRIELGRDGEHWELLVDGVPYSSFHPDRPWSGYVWDALAATVLLCPTAAPSVLLLGCGGGTVLQLVRRLRPAARLTAVELDPRVLRFARRRFGLGSEGAEIVEGDGVEFLARTRRRFDLVVDDMYAPSASGLARPVRDEVAHLRRVSERLAPRGVAVTNATSDDDPPGLEIAVRDAHHEIFAHRVALEPRLGENVVLVGSRRRLETRALRRPRGIADAFDREGLAGVRVRKA
jgi:spermidine synthase